MRSRQDRANILHVQQFNQLTGGPGSASGFSKGPYPGIFIMIFPRDEKLLSFAGGCLNRNIIYKGMTVFQVLN